jgi:anti-anti-sigma factor
VITFLARHYCGEQDQEELRELLGRLIDGGCRRLVLDLGGVEEWDSPGFEAQFLEAHRRLRREGGALALCRVDPEKRQMFSIMGWDRFLRFYPDRDSAVSGVRGEAGGA